MKFFDQQIDFSIKKIMLSLIAVVLAVAVTAAQDNFISLEQAANTSNNDAVVNQNADGADAYVTQRGGNGN